MRAFGGKMAAAKGRKPAEEGVDMLYAHFILEEIR